MAIVQIQGYTFWLNFLPPIWRARVLAESVRVTYQGKFPWGSAQMLGVGDQQPGWELQMQMPDGMCWNLRPVDGPEAPPKNRFALFVSRTFLRHVPGATRTALFVDWIRSWIYEIRLMRGTSPFAHWAVKHVALPRLPTGGIP